MKEGAFMAIYSQKKTCNQCKGCSKGDNGAFICALGYAVSMESGICVPTVPCPKPTTRAALERLQHLSTGDHEPCSELPPSPFSTAPERSLTPPDPEESPQIPQFDGKIRYLIDTENMGREWLDILQEDSPEKIYYLLCTSASPNVPLSSILSFCKLFQEERLQVVTCNRGSPNALDFQLIFLLGKLSEAYKNDHFIIISKDKGYDAVIQNSDLSSGRISRDSIQSPPSLLSADPHPSPIDTDDDLIQTMIHLKCPPEMIADAAVFAKEAQHTASSAEARAKAFRKALIQKYERRGQSFYDQHRLVWKSDIFASK